MLKGVITPEPCRSVIKEMYTGAVWSPDAAVQSCCGGDLDFAQRRYR